LLLTRSRFAALGIEAEILLRSGGNLLPRDKQKIVAESPTRVAGSAKDINILFVRA
jgi:hypothetical protein